jgi:hypothetical protein
MTTFDIGSLLSSRAWTKEVLALFSSRRTVIGSRSLVAADRGVDP